MDIQNLNKLGILKEHNDLISSLIKINELSILSGSYDSTIKLWNV